MNFVKSSNPLRAVSKDGSRHVTNEVYNSLISATGSVLAALASIFLLILPAWQAHKPWHVVGFTIYGLCAFNLFLSSALHHGLDGSERLEHALLQWDYFSIFTMITGTFTPICLILLEGKWRGLSLGVLWTLAAIGILLKAYFPKLPRWVSLIFYTGMGWMGVLVFPQIISTLGWAAVEGLLAGGAFFTFGSIIYFTERPNPAPGKFGFHEIWHLCVVAGAACHFAVIYYFLLPYGG